MKNFFIIVSILLFGLPCKSNPIVYKDKEISLISFNITINTEIKKFLDQFASQFPEFKNSNGDKIIAKIQEKTWDSFADVMQKDIGMLILPITTFGKSASYDPYGFPDISISKAQQKGFSKYYMKIDVKIEPEVSQYANSNKAKRGDIKPMVTITLTTFPKKGIIPLGKYTGTTIASDVWTTENTSFLDGLINDNIKNDLFTLMGLINEAINDLATNISAQ